MEDAIGEDDTKELSKEGTRVASNKKGDNEEFIINDNLDNSPSAAIGDTTATST